MHNLAETEAPSINKIICPSSGLAGKSVESVCELVMICICIFPRTSTMSELLNPTPLLKRFILAFELEAGSLGIPLITPAINHLSFTIAANEAHQNYSLPLRETRMPNLRRHHRF